MRIVIDVLRCSGQGRCYTLTPELFTDDDRGFGQVLGDGTVTDGLQAAARTAILACPEHAISLVED